MLPGLSAPKVSWVTLPMAPVGVVSVSPVTRQATSARKNDRRTASTLCQTGMSKLDLASHTMATSATNCPRKNHDIGASTLASTSVPASGFPPNILPTDDTAFTMLRHCRKKASRPEVTMQLTPPHSGHCTISR